MPRASLKERPARAHPTVGCCGIDCGLCPRYYTDGASRCPGCGGPDFFQKHPPCGALSCCAGKKELVACSLCDEFPCPRLGGWTEKDSFVTHQRCRSNLESIRAEGMTAFLRQQGKRIRLLEKMLKELDDGQSKSFYCLAAALLPVEELASAVRGAARQARQEKVAAGDRKARATLLRSALAERAGRAGVELTLRRG